MKTDCLITHIIRNQTSVSYTFESENSNNKV